MKLYCKGKEVLAVHEDHMDVPPEAYGAGVVILEVTSTEDAPAGYYSKLPLLPLRETK